MNVPNANTHPPAAPTSWISHKNQGKRFYDQNDYASALESYRQSLDSLTVTCGGNNLESSTSGSSRKTYHLDQQILLSNMVACRLHLGGPENAQAAVNEAKQCVALNPQWSKGHVRLASAYLAMGSHHSNEACNELQTALRLDPGNTTARQMLIRELRGRDRPRQPQPTGQCNLDEENIERDSPLNPNYRDDRTTTPADRSTTVPEHASRTASSFVNASTHPVAANTVQDESGMGIDDALTWKERLQYYALQAQVWYTNDLSDAQRTWFKLGLVFVVLYLLFAMGSTNRHSYKIASGGGGGSTNIYEEYRKQRQRQTTTGMAGSPSYPYSSQRNAYGGDSSTYYSQSSSSFSWSLSNLFDGSPFSIILLGSILYVAHRYGINPLQALWMLQMVAGRRHHQPGGWAGRGGFYGGGGGFGVPPLARWGDARRGRQW